MSSSFYQPASQEGGEFCPRYLGVVRQYLPRTMPLVDGCDFPRQLLLASCQASYHQTHAVGPASLELLKARCYQ